MLPPSNVADDKPAIEAPLKEWSVKAAFDRAQDSNEEMALIQKGGAAAWDATAKNSKILGAAGAYAQCIATDDPRLAK